MLDTTIFKFGTLSDYFISIEHIFLFDNYKYSLWTVQRQRTTEAEFLEILRQNKYFKILSLVLRI